MKGTTIAIILVVLVFGAVIAFFLLTKKQAAPVDPINQAVGGIMGWVNSALGIASNVVAIPVRIANDVVSVVEAPFKAIGKLFS
jgi:hypothetical protein